MPSRQMFYKPDWVLPEGVQVQITTRFGGLSCAPYDEFNLAEHLGDKIESVTANRHLLTSHLGLDKAPIWLAQNHGAEVYSVTDQDAGQDITDVGNSAGASRWFSTLASHVIVPQAKRCWSALA